MVSVQAADVGRFAGSHKPDKAGSIWLDVRRLVLFEVLDESRPSIDGTDYLRAA